MQLAELLDEKAKLFDEEWDLLGQNTHHPGYHTAKPQGAYLHGTRANFEYAVLLLRSENPEHHARADRVLRRVLACQDADPVSPTFGIWPWYADESLEEMDKPDYNWADFCGAMIAAALIENADRLPAETVAAMRRALDRAAAAIFRRNVGPSYTNIAVMGATVTAVAGEILEEPRWLEYGRRRMARFIEYTRQQGGFNEYNSPTYTFVALREAERALELVSDPGLRESAEQLRRMAWQHIAERFHPATGQMAGPHSRAYSDLLGADRVRDLRALTGVDIPGPETDDLDPQTVIGKRLPCPEDLRRRFAQLPEDPTTVRGCFIRREPEEASTTGTTWLTQQAAIGSVNYDSLWVQRRPLLAYIQAPGEPAVFKVRLLRDGKPCAAGVLRSAQEGPRVLCAMQLATDMGDHHIHMDAPAGGVYRCADLRLRFELTGGDVALEELPHGAFALAAGDWRVAVHGAPAVFDDRDCQWEASQSDGNACVDAVFLHEESERPLPVADVGRTLAAAGVELIRRDEAPQSAPPEIEEQGDRALCRWAGLQLATRTRPHPFKAFAV